MGEVGSGLVWRAVQAGTCGRETYLGSRIPSDGRPKARYSLWWGVSGGQGGGWWVVGESIQ